MNDHYEMPTQDAPDTHTSVTNETVNVAIAETETVFTDLLVAGVNTLADLITLYAVRAVLDDTNLQASLPNGQAVR